MNADAEFGQEQLADSLIALRAAVVSRTGRAVRVSALDSQNALPSGLLADSGVRAQLSSLANNPLNESAAAVRALRALPDGKGSVLLKYVARCALPQSDTATLRNAPGRLALVPDWRLRKLQEDEQRWITACLMAHTNNLAHVDIALSGVRPSTLASTLGGTPQHFAVEEAAFFGNVFASNPALYACGGAGAAAVCGDRGVSQDLTRRICGSTKAERCGFSYLGPCNTLSGTGVPAPAVCTTALPYASCRDSAGRRYSEVVTTSLRTDVEARGLAPSCWQRDQPLNCTDHDACTVGGPLATSCNSVCLSDMYCCTQAWDSSCVDAARRAGACL